MREADEILQVIRSSTIRALAFLSTMCGIQAPKASAALISTATIRFGCPHHCLNRANRSDSPRRYSLHEEGSRNRHGGGGATQDCAALGLLFQRGNFFNASWRDEFWGKNYSKLRAIKTKYDPAGLFFVHHGVGSEDWSADGFERL